MICGDIWVSCDAKNYGNYGFLVMQMGVFFTFFSYDSPNKYGILVTQIGISRAKYRDFD
jgi:hypothetical protein